MLFRGGLIRERLLPCTFICVFFSLFVFSIFLQTARSCCFHLGKSNTMNLIPATAVAQDEL